MNEAALCAIFVVRKTALLSQEGSGIAKRIPRGVVPITKRFGLGTTPRKISTASRSCCPPDSGGQFFRLPNSTISTELGNENEQLVR
jgi:hypothetical protein